MTASLWGFFGGISAWIVTNFIAQPLNTFLAARSGAARALARYADLDYYDPEQDDPPPETIFAREKVLADSAAELIAFSHANQLLSNCLKIFRLFPQKAGDQLRLLSDMKPYGSQNEDMRHQVMRHLRLGRKFGPYSRI